MKNIYQNQMNIVNSLFNDNQFKYIGISEEKFKDEYKRKIAGNLFFLQADISSILMPYVIKVENELKQITNTSSLYDAINEMRKRPANYINKFMNKDKIKKISNKRQCDVFAQLLFMFRVSRNKVMHGESAFLGYFLNERDIEGGLLKKMIEGIYTKELIAANLRLFKKAKICSFNSEGMPSYLSIIILTIFFFNSRRVTNKIHADIDYLIFLFRTKTNISKEETLWNKLGLKIQWVNK